MSRPIEQEIVETLGGNAKDAADYLDACDAGLFGKRIDAGYYKACAGLLTTVFTVVDAQRIFPALLERSPAAREIAETQAIGERLRQARRSYSPQLAALLDRIGE